jgi:hypothetical protein
VNGRASRLLAKSTKPINTLRGRDVERPHGSGFREKVRAPTTQQRDEFLE